MKDFPKLGKIQSSRLVRKPPFSNRKKSARLGVAWGMLFLVAAFFVAQRVEYLRAERRVRSLMEQKRQLLADILPLKLEESHLTRIGRVEGLATQMGLAPAAEWQKFYLSPPARPEDPIANEPETTRAQPAEAGTAEPLKNTEKPGTTEQPEVK